MKRSCVGVRGETGEHEEAARLVGQVDAVVAVCEQEHRALGGHERGGGCL